MKHDDKGDFFELNQDLISSVNECIEEIKKNVKEAKQNYKRTGIKNDILEVKEDCEELYNGLFEEYLEHIISIKEIVYESKYAEKKEIGLDVLIEGKEFLRKKLLYVLMTEKSLYKLIIE